MTTSVFPSSNISNRPTFSCVRCADRKVKCNRQKPCSACIRHNVDCVFKTSQAPQRKQKRVKVQALADRLKQYETLLQEQGIDPQKVPQTLDSGLNSKTNHVVPTKPEEVHLQIASSTEPDQDQYGNEMQSSYDQVRFKFVENTLWKRVIEESHDTQDISEDVYDSSDLDGSEEGLCPLFNIQQTSHIRLYHPPPTQICQLWEIFIENVDPLTKIVHVPTLRPAIQKAVSNLTTIPRTLEILMFAIYSSAIMSLKDDECRQRFSEPRTSLMSTYVRATEVALARANFMGTTSLVILQALVLHLFSVRDTHEPRVVWTLTGVAVRIAQSIGLARDGTSLGLPLFETEMRRRIWWQLKLHDFRTAELCGLAKFRDLDTGHDSTQWPTNVNDDQLYPGMTSLVAETKDLTDSVFVTVRCEFTKFAASRIASFRRQGIDASQWNLDKSNEDEKEKGFKDLQELLETNYLRYCDPSQPLHLMTMLAGRYAINVVRFLTHHPRKWKSIEQTPSSERVLVWEISLKLLEQHNMAYSNPLLKRFSWHTAYFQQWHAFIHVLDVLRVQPTNPDADKAWQLVSNTYEHTPAMSQDVRKPIHVAVGNLSLKAYRSREAAWQKQNLTLPPTPDFIFQLRHHQEAAMARRQARKAKETRPASNFNPGPDNSYDMTLSSNLCTLQAIDTTSPTTLHQSALSEALHLDQTCDANENDPFHLFNSVEDGQSNSLDMGLDLLLAEDYNMGSGDTETINWEQWDTWLSNSNLMRSLPS